MDLSSYLSLCAYQRSLYTPGVFVSHILLPIASCKLFLCSHMLCYNNVHPCNIQETSHYRERRRQRMRPRQPTPRVRVFSHTRGGSAGAIHCRQQPPLWACVNLTTRTRTAGCLGRIPCRRRSLLSHGVVLCPVMFGRATAHTHNIEAGDSG